MRALFLGVVLLSLGLMGLTACGRDLRTAQGVAEEFVDQHYVFIDLQRAREYTVGLALQKLDEEIRLTAGQVIDLSTRKPKIHYRLLEKKEAQDHASFLYEGTIQAEDAPEFKRRWMVTARKAKDHWRISNFTDYD